MRSAGLSMEDIFPTKAIDMRSESSPAIDIFNLGSICYTIMAGTWPFRPPGLFPCRADKEKYEGEVHALLTQGIFPDVSTLDGGEVILGCWKRKYKTAQEVLDAFEECGFVTN